MATLDDLPRLLAEDVWVREDFLATIAGFFARHGIDVTPADIVGAGVDTRGFLSPGEPPTGQAPGNAPIRTSSLLYRDGANTSRVVWL